MALVMVALVWGVTFVVVKRALTEISPLYFLASRFSLASICLLIIFLPAFHNAGLRAVLRGLKGGAIAGVFLWLGYVLQTIGLKYTSAGNSGFLTGLYIVLVPLIGAAIYRKLPTLPETMGLTMAVGGMALITAPSMDREFRMNRGDALTLGCAVVFAVHLLVLGYYSQRERFEPVAVGQILCAAVLSWASLPLEGPKAVWSKQVLFAIVLTALFATALAFALQTWCQKYTTATRVALIFALEPVFALATAVSVGGERLTWTAAAGGVLILTGILSVELIPARRS